MEDGDERLRDLVSGLRKLTDLPSYARHPQTHPDIMFVRTFELSGTAYRKPGGKCCDGVGERQELGPKRHRARPSLLDPHDTEGVKPSRASGDGVVIRPIDMRN